MSGIELGYWFFRGLGEPIRYLLHYKNVKFVDKRYQFDGTWEKEKFNLGLDFPNLPYYMDDKVKLTQSTTILRYLAKKYDLEGETEEEKLRISLIEQQIKDLGVSFFQNVVLSDSDEKRKNYLNVVQDSLRLYSKFLGDRDFFGGKNISYVDFVIYDQFDFHVLFSKTILDDFPNLKAYVERFRNLPELQEYLNSPSYIRWPIVGPPGACAWGSSGTMPEVL